MFQNMLKVLTLLSIFFTTTLFAQANPKTLNLDIKGMNCPMCAAKIENSIKKLGVSKCSIDDKTGKGVVEYDEAKVNAEQIIETCNKSGFKCSKI